MTVSVSGSGMMTRCWGPASWFFLHCVSVNYPLNPTSADKSRYLEFFRSLQWILPCKSCRESYADLIAKKGPTKLTLATMKNRETVALWLYHVHCAVNKRIGKKTSISFQGMCKKYEQFRATSCDKHTCDQDQAKKRKRMVVLAMDDVTYSNMGFRSSLCIINPQT